MYLLLQMPPYKMEDSIMYKWRTFGRGMPIC